MRLFLTSLVVVVFGLISAGIVRADPWPKFAFSDWPSIPVSKIKDKEPVVFPMDVPGSIQPKPKQPAPVRRTCQEKQPGGYFLPVSC